MWKAFANYCLANRLHLSTLTEADINRFLQTRPARGGGEAAAVLSARYQWRFLVLIDRLLRLDAEQRGTAPNLAAHALLQRPPHRRANAVEQDEAPRFLSASDTHRLIEYLEQSIADGKQAASWRRARDAAAVTVMLGGGLTPAEVRRLRLADVIRDKQEGGLPTSLHIPSADASRAGRRTPLPEWAGRILLAWLRQRAGHGIDGEQAFPATRTGKVWSHTGCQQACGAVLQRAGLADEKAGLFQLRHAFAIRHLAAGTPEHLVAAWLGYRDADSVMQYRGLAVVEGETTDGAPPKQL
ncbi:MAG TPA: site-specific integrase [Noviherbaspirillum sp.]|jgi:integrase|uniref:tyrosine-type recombinase/integrase n=1 Tax=Noviherbaspirillum sp. TaxID=1926288 RepID=UPI002F921835